MNAHPRPYYYLENFTVALDWLRSRYRELLSDEERRFITDFTRLPVESAALVVRMIMRQGDLFRTGKLNYAEIGCPRQAAVPLIERGWLDPHPGVSFPNLCRLLRKAELCSALGLRGAARSVRKAEPIPLVGEIAAETRPLDAWWLYVENALLNSLFGLLCWNAIFAPLPGAFFHEFHAAPADLLEADFHRRRSADFAACLAQLEGGTYRDSILRTFEAKAGIQSPFIPWGALSRQELELALDCIPPAHLQKFFERLLTDVRANRSGLPDLIQLWRDERRYRLIEVKGPGDRLQDNQIRWLNFCLAQDIPVAVCKVKWQAVPS